MTGLEFLGLVMLLVMLAAIFIGLPISFTLLFLALIFGYMGLGTKVFNLAYLQIWGTMKDEIFPAVPLFIFMGYMTEQAGLMERLFGALRTVGVSVIVISQASSEHSICIAVPEAQADLAGLPEALKAWCRASTLPGEIVRLTAAIAELAGHRDDVGQLRGALDLPLLVVPAGPDVLAVQGDRAELAGERLDRFLRLQPQVGGRAEDRLHGGRHEHVRNKQ